VTRATIATVVVVAALSAGCSLVLAPDRDAIVYGVDGGPDAGDGGPDGGPDGGGDGGTCQPVAEVCSNGADDDCDGRADCFDPDCVSDARCCRTGLTTERLCLASGFDVRRVPAEASASIRFSDTLCSETSRLLEFGPPARTRALITEECQPINFGMRFEATFEIAVSCGTLCDHAALAFTPLQTLVDDVDPLASELRVVVSSDGSARVERGGTVLRDDDGQPIAREAGHFGLGVPIEVRVELWPGPDDIGRDVLYATVDLIQAGVLGSPRLLDRGLIMPLADLRCLRPGGTSEPGLYAAIEGSGDGVQVVGTVARIEHECSNPSQFRPQQAVDTRALTACAPGGVGAPALASYCRAGCDTAAAQYQWDLWVDASELSRAEDNFQFLDFGICGHAASQPRFPTGAAGDGWLARGAPGYLWPTPPSAREPTLLPVSDDGDAERVSYLWYAYAERVSARSDVHAIRGGQVFPNPAQSPAGPRSILTPEATPGLPCDSVRDPLLVARHAPLPEGGHSVVGAWLFYTCEREERPRSIAVTALDMGLDPIEGTTAIVIDESVGEYARRGVFAPEGFTSPGPTETTLRLWFSTRDDEARVRLAFAQGRGPLEDLSPPELEAYPANPILDGNDPVLGDDCGGSCTLTGLSVTPSDAERGDFQFLVSRSRVTPAGTSYELVPLLQPAPPD
jgi:hypothetical protein